jgi:hypothetical protein
MTKSVAYQYITKFLLVFIYKWLIMIKAKKFKFSFFVGFATEQAIIGHTNANGNHQFLISVLLNLFQIKYQNSKNSPFDIHVTIISVFITVIFLWSSIGGNNQTNSKQELHPSSYAYLWHIGCLGVFFTNIDPPFLWAVPFGFMCIRIEFKGITRLQLEDFWVAPCVKYSAH